MPKAVQFDSYGGINVLEVREAFRQVELRHTRQIGAPTVSTGGITEHNLRCARHLPRVERSLS